MAQLHTDAAPSRARKGAGRYRQPIALLARLGIAIGHERAGLAAGMLQDITAGVSYPTFFQTCTRAKSEVSRASSISQGRQRMALPQKTAAALSS
jgi:hypothetical protein